MSGFVCMSQDCDHQHVFSLYCLFSCAYISVFCVSLHVVLYFFECLVTSNHAPPPDHQTTLRFKAVITKY